jgi:putative copper resistance protein D
MLMVQGGLMGNGWPDLWQPAIWQAVAGTRFGSVWIWQILLAWIALAIAWLKPRRPARLLLVLCAQILLMAGVGHAVMSEGVRARRSGLTTLSSVLRRQLVWRLLPFIYCLRLARGRWRQAAIGTMMRFSRYGHLAVAGAIASGVLNALLIQGGLFRDSPWGEMLLIKCALVAGMVAIALVNRYVLVPRMSESGTRAEQLICAPRRQKWRWERWRCWPSACLPPGNLTELTG